MSDGIRTQELSQQHEEGCLLFLSRDAESSMMTRREDRLSLPRECSAEEEEEDSFLVSIPRTIGNNIDN